MELHRITSHNIIFAKVGVWCFYESKVLNSSFVLLMKFSAKNPRLRKYENLCMKKSSYNKVFCK
ncbi:MAG: hypothetical protein EAZ44_09080 [Cytophagia bacterium]|nr:MAG: hypothetical protein EAZ44_09080 [Cytophagia bacterium]